VVLKSQTKQQRANDSNCNFNGALLRLREAGLLGEARTHPASNHARRTPVEIKGKPLSETIIEERG